MFIQANENSPFHKAYMTKMTEVSFSQELPFDAIRNFLKKDNSAFYTNKGYIPEDVNCKVRINFDYL